MARATRMAAAIAALAVMVSCQAASATPKIGGKGPVITAKRQSGAPGRCQVGATDEGLETLAFKMTSPTTGWTLGKCSLAAPLDFPSGSTVKCLALQPNWMGILRTADGGATWTDVSPPGVANRTWHRAQFFLDGDHAWVGEVSRNADSCVSAVTTFVTTDGGHSWTQGATVPLRMASPSDDVNNVFGPEDNMDFVDAQHGWLMVVSIPATPDPSGLQVATTVYATSDGGMHWRLVATNPGKAALAGAGCPQNFYAPTSDITFSSPTEGWLSLSCSPGVLVLTTRDGGSTWTPRPLPACGCNAYQSQFLDADHAVVFGQQTSPVMLTTSDAGSKWTQRALPAAALKGFSFIDPSNGWMVGIAQLPSKYETVVYRTSNGGQTWSLLSKPGFTTVAANARAFFPIQRVQFFNEQAGFVLLGAEGGLNGAQPSPGVPDLQLFRTADGGRTWTAVLQEVPTAQCAASYRQLGFGNGGLMPVKMVSATVGWGRGGLRTTDGGVHWKDVSSSLLREGSVTSLYPPDYSEFYLDGDHGWQAAVYGSSTVCFDHVSTFATSDGGKTWQKSSPIMLNLPANTQVSGTQMGFTSPQSGWLWLPRSQQSDDSMGRGPYSEADLYATNDGGITWRHASHVTSSNLAAPTPAQPDQKCKPSLGQIEFSSASVGWLTANCAQAAMLVSRDGGVTWNPATLPTSGQTCPCYDDGPKFVDADHGSIVVSGSGGLTGNTGLLVTSDGGTTWRTAASPGTGFVLIMDWVSADDVYALVTPPGWTKGPNMDKQGFELYRSSDGAGTWTKVAAPVPATWPPGFMQFVDLKHGFEANTNGADVLLTTADGGVTWKSIVPAVG